MLRYGTGHQFKSREARDHFRDVLDAAETGEPVVIRRRLPVVMLRRDIADQALARDFPLNPRVSVGDDHVAMWLDGLPVHAEASTYDEAEDALLDALLDYVDLWTRELRHAPNHAPNAGYVYRLAMYAGDREELRSIVFAD